MIKGQKGTEKPEQQMVTTKIALTAPQRKQLARALSIEVQYVPAELGVVGLQESSAKGMGVVPGQLKAKFSPAIIMV